MGNALARNFPSLQPRGKIFGTSRPVLPMMHPKQPLRVAVNLVKLFFQRVNLGCPPVMTVAIAVAVTGALVISALWSAHTEIGRLRLLSAQLEVENSTYRVAASELSEQITSLSSEMSELSRRSEIDPSISRSMARLPSATRIESAVGVGSTMPFETFDRLDGFLDALDSRLDLVRRGVAYREALAAATPIMWPADGWISGTYGYRDDPFTGERDFHPAVDISTQKGQPVYATATGRVLSAQRNGNYGNLVEIDHGFDRTTRYGHLAEFAVSVGDTVQRGDVIGYVGATGRATGYHVHYEVRTANRTIDPMRLLARSDTASAN